MKGDTQYIYTDPEGRTHRVSDIAEVPQDRHGHLVVVSDGNEDADEAPAAEGPSATPEAATAVGRAGLSDPLPASAPAATIPGSWLVLGALALAGLLSGNNAVRGLCLCAALLLVYGKGGGLLGSGGGSDAAPTTMVPVSPPSKGIILASLDGAFRRAKGPCRAARCLTIYVAPWCPFCRRSTSRFIAMRKFLAGRGVPTIFVVGGAELGLCEEYAQEFGPKTLLDPNASLQVPGYPHFIITDANGATLSEGPANLDSDNMESHARALGLI